MKVALLGAECEESLAIRYLEAALRAKGHETLIIPFNSKEETDRASQELAESGADLAGLSMVFTYRAHEFAELAVQARRDGFAGHIIAGGHFAAFNAAGLLKEVPAIDSVGIGEGEQIMCDLADHIDDLAKVPGLVWTDKDGDLVENESATKLSDLDSLPFPTHKDPPDCYLGLPIANLLSSRGCTHNCFFCSIAAWHGLCGGKRVRMRSPGHVASEMERLYNRGYRIFNFHDDNFILKGAEESLERVKALKHELDQRAVRHIAFAIKSRPNSVDEKLFRYMKGMGLFRVFVGIEAGTTESLEQLGRRQTVDDNRNALRILNELDLHVCFNLLIFNPDSRLEDVRLNVAFLRENNCNPVNFCRTEVYAGTPLYQKLEEQGRLKGSRWGYGYDMADVRSQLAFELMHETMFDRHHPPENLHHLTMGVDYELKLAGQFFGISRRISARARAFIEEVNNNSCDYLERILDAAEQGFASDEVRGEFVLAMKRNVDADSRELTAKGESIRHDIRQSVARSMRTTRWLQKAAAVGIITAAAASAGAQDEWHGGHMTEMIAVPPAEQPTGKGDDAKPEKKPATSLPAGDTADVMRDFSRNVLKPLAMGLRPAQDVQVEMWVDKDGKIIYLDVMKSDAKQAVSADLTKEQQEQAKVHLEKIGTGKFQEREAATAALKELGAAVIPLLRDTLKSAKDPEVITRCKDVLSAVEGVLEFKERSRVIGQMKAYVFRADKQKGKRYVIKVNAATLEQIWDRYNMPTQIFEMAPGPLD